MGQSKCKNGEKKCFKTLQVKGPKLKLKHNTTEEQVQTNEILENPFFQMLISVNIVIKYFIFKKDLTKQLNKDHPNTVLEHEEYENIKYRDDNSEKQRTIYIYCFKCQICIVVQTTKGKLKRHLKTIMGIEIGYVIVSFKQMTFQRIQNLLNATMHENRTHRRHKSGYSRS